jgi:hypothetical protein
MRGYGKDNPPNTDHKFTALVPVSRGTHRNPRRSRSRQRRCPLCGLSLTAAVFWTGIAYDCASKLQAREGARQRRLAGATIRRIGSPEEKGIEGGGLILDYRRPGDHVVRRVVFGFTELGMWVEWEGPIQA